MTNPNPKRLMFLVPIVGALGLAAGIALPIPEQEVIVPAPDEISAIAIYENEQEAHFYWAVDANSGSELDTLPHLCAAPIEDGKWARYDCNESRFFRADGTSQTLGEYYKAQQDNPSSQYNINEAKRQKWSEENPIPEGLTDEEREKWASDHAMDWLMAGYKD